MSANPYEVAFTSQFFKAQEKLGRAHRSAVSDAVEKVQV